MIEINKIYNQNCLKTMKEIPDNFVDLTFTSPPYNMQMRTRNGEYTERNDKEHFSIKYKYFEDNLSIEEYEKFHEEVLTELLRISKTIMWNISIVSGSKEAVFNLMGKFSRNIKDVIIWDKGFGQPAINAGVLNRASEWILVLENDAKIGRTFNRYYFKRGTLQDIWRIRNKSTNNINKAVFPEKLVETAIKNFSKENDIIYDPFSGTGTTCLIAKRMNRNYIGSELITECYDYSIDRLEKENKVEKSSNNLKKFLSQQTKNPF